MVRAVGSFGVNGQAARRLKDPSSAECKIVGQVAAASPGKEEKGKELTWEKRASLSRMVDTRESSNEKHRACHFGDFSIFLLCRLLAIVTATDRIQQSAVR